MITLQLAQPRNIAVKTSPFRNADTSIISVSAIEVISITDNCLNKVIATVKIPNSYDVRKIVLWEGAAYDTIGEWTQEQANEKILELIST